MILEGLAMTQNNTDNPPEQPMPETSESSQIPSEPVPAPEVKVEKPKPGRVQRFFRNLLLWLVLLALAFLAGLATDEYLRYRPLSASIHETQTKLDQANQSVSDLQAEIERLMTANQQANDKITSLEGDKKALQDELDTANAHLKLLQVLVDVSNARLSLFLNDVEGAKAALVNTPQRLDDLLPFISEFDTNLAKSMPQRLDLILSGLERDTETVKIDLELLSKDLLEIEAAMFGNQQ
jgi:cell division protein FtsB